MIITILACIYFITEYGRTTMAPRLIENNNEQPPNYCCDNAQTVFYIIRRTVCKEGFYYYYFFLPTHCRNFTCSPAHPPADRVRVYIPRWWCVQSTMRARCRYHQYMTWGWRRDFFSTTNASYTKSAGNILLSMYYNLFIIL